jgi:hypothetical protein
MIGNKSTLGKRGPKANAWKCGKTINKRATYIYKPDHPQAVNGKYVAEHKLKAEKALGKILPNKAVIHHVDGNRHNNKNENIVICDSQSYHLLIHQRARAYNACGNAKWLRCRYCKKYDDPKNLYIKERNNGNGYSHIRHRKCHAIAMKSL